MAETSERWDGNRIRFLAALALASLSLFEVGCIPSALASASVMPSFSAVEGALAPRVAADPAAAGAPRKAATPRVKRQAKPPVVAGFVPSEAKGKAAADEPCTAEYLDCFDPTPPVAEAETVPCARKLVLRYAPADGGLDDRDSLLGSPMGKVTVVPDLGSSASGDCS